MYVKKEHRLIQIEFEFKMYFCEFEFFYLKFFLKLF